MYRINSKKSQGTPYMSEISPTITKFIISRRCNLPLVEMNSLRSDELFDCFKKLKESEALKFTNSSLLINSLYQQIPLVDEADRASLVQLKRDLYNDREIGRFNTEILKLPSLEQIKVHIEALNSINQDIQNLKIKIQLLYEDYLFNSRAVIAQFCSKENFQKSIQLSGQRLINIVKEYQDAFLSNTKINKKLKQTEDTLISYFFRMILKPSPFASFNTIRAHIKEKYSKKNNPAIYRFCSISRVLIQWLSTQCLSHEKLINYLPLRLNSTISVGSKEIVFFVRPDEGSRSIYSGEKYIKIDHSEAMKKIISLLADKELSKAELVDIIGKKSNLQDNLSSYIEDLIKIGFLERRLLIPDLTLRYAKHVGEILSQYEDTVLKSLSDHFHKIHGIEVAFEVATVSERQGLLSELRKTLDEILNSLGLENPGFDDVRTYVYEDVGEICHDVDSKIDEFKKYGKEFLALSKILPLHDDAMIERVSLYNLFNTIYLNAETVNLLEFYRVFAKLDVDKLTKVMSGTYSTEAAEIKKLRSQWIEMLDSRINSSLGQHSINIDNDWLKNFIQLIPEYLGDSNSTILYLQKSGIFNEPSLMFNGASMGYGALFSRFCSIFGDSNNMIKEALIDALRENTDISEFFDLTAVLGVNTNLHPILFKNFIEYPGCMSEKISSDSKIYKLNELLVKADHVRHRLFLIHAKTGEEINLRPLNFLFPGIGPNLYRFIYLFSPYLNYRGGIWRRYLDNRNDDKISILPQIKIGNLILDRKTWKFPIKGIPKFPSLQENILSCLNQLQEWCMQWELPDQVFYRQGEKRPSQENWILAMREYISFANKARIRKPHFLDFKNPFLIRIFLKHIANKDSNDLIIQECIPSASYQENGEEKFTEEFLLQINH